MHQTTSSHRYMRQSGNVLFMILIGVALFAALSFAVSQSMRSSMDISDEQLELKINKFLTQASNIKSGVDMLYNNGIGEADISFAYPLINGYGTFETSPSDEVFNPSGGGVSYSDLPEGLNDGSQIEFYGHTRAPDIGLDDTADLILVAPNVTVQICQKINNMISSSTTADIQIPDDNNSDSKCVYTSSTDQYDGTFSSTPNQMDGGTNDFTVTPAPYGCVKCADDSYHIFYTLLER